MVQDSGTTVVVWAGASRATSVPATIVGRIKQETNLDTIRPGGRPIVLRCLALGSAMMSPGKLIYQDWIKP
jgi:hypothetical protein